MEISKVYKKEVINSLINSNDPLLLTKIYYDKNSLNVNKIITTTSSGFVLLYHHTANFFSYDEEHKDIIYKEFAGKIDDEIAEFIYETHMFYAEKFNLRLFI